MGRATALAFARQGANLVLAGGNRCDLEEIAFHCFDLGATPHVVVMDVTRPAALPLLEQEALQAFGQVDEWVHAQSTAPPLARVGTALALMAVAWWGVRPALRARLQGAGQQKSLPQEALQVDSSPA